MEQLLLASFALLSDFASNEWVVSESTCCGDMGSIYNSKTFSLDALMWSFLKETSSCLRHSFFLLKISPEMIRGFTVQKDVMKRPEKTDGKKKTMRQKI